jgi:hypothetical protein
MSYPPSKRFFAHMGEESNKLHEGAKAHSAFLRYCELGPGRTLERVRLELGARPSYIRMLTEWSRRYHWVTRAKAFDLAAKEEELAANEKELKKMNQRHAEAGVANQLKALAQIDRLIKSGKMGSIATVQLLKISYDLERLARGAETEISHVELTGMGGGPVQTDSRVVVYLPQKDVLPEPRVVVEQDTPAARQALPREDDPTEDLQQRLAVIKASLEAKKNNYY